MRRTYETKTKVGHSDLVIMNERVITQRIKGTQGITGYA
jgi:hypothetical protein